MPKEAQLEEKYRYLLAYTEAKDAIQSRKNFTAGKIRGAITRFCRTEDIADRPRNFVEQEAFAIEMLDWWQDENPEIFATESEGAVEAAINAYLAHVSTWKAKYKDGTIATGEMAIAAGTMLTVKNTLAGGVKTICSLAKRHPQISSQEVQDGFKAGFSALLPVIHDLQTGKIELPEGVEVEDISRLIAGYLAGNQSVIQAAEGLKQIAASN